MGDFAVWRAFSAGVGLIERRGKSVLAWGVVLMLIGLLPRLLMMAHSGMSLHDLSAADTQNMAQMSNLGSGPEGLKSWAQHMSAAQSSHGASGLHGLLMLLWTLAGGAVVQNAIYRAVIRPQDSGAASLRLGGAEFWQFLVKLSQLVLGVCAALLAIGAVIVWTLLAKALPTPWSGWVMYLGVAGLVVLYLWVGLRLSMAGPMTLAEGKFRLFESWAFTKGRAWKLFWTMLLPAALLLGLYLFVVAGLMFLWAPIMLGAATFQALAPGMELSSAGGMAVMGLFGIVYLLIVGFLAGAAEAIASAPFAQAYAEMSGKEG